MYMYIWCVRTVCGNFETLQPFWFVAFVGYQYYSSFSSFFSCPSHLSIYCSYLHHSMIHFILQHNILLTFLTSLTYIFISHPPWLLGATKVMIMLDENTHPSVSLLDASMSPLQGPALIVANDAMFTESDFRSECILSCLVLSCLVLCYSVLTYIPNLLITHTYLVLTLTPTHSFITSHRTPLDRSSSYRSGLKAREAS